MKTWTERREGGREIKNKSFLQISLDDAVVAAREGGRDTKEKK